MLFVCEALVELGGAKRSVSKMEKQKHDLPGKGTTRREDEGAVAGAVGGGGEEGGGQEAGEAEEGEGGGVEGATTRISIRRD